MLVTHNGVVYKYLGVPLTISAGSYQGITKLDDGYYRLIIGKLTRVLDQSDPGRELLSVAILERAHAGSLHGERNGPNIGDQTWQQVQPFQISHAIRELILVPLKTGTLVLIAELVPHGPESATCHTALTQLPAGRGFGIRAKKRPTERTVDLITFDLVEFPPSHKRIKLPRANPLGQRELPLNAAAQETGHGTNL